MKKNGQNKDYTLNEIGDFPLSTLITISFLPCNPFNMIPTVNCYRLFEESLETFVVINLYKWYRELLIAS